MKHTKGKWSINQSGHSDFKLCIVAEDRGSICHVTNWKEAKDNAKLIGKCPEMYEALKKLANMHPDGNPLDLIKKAQSLLKEIS